METEMQAETNGAASLVEGETRRRFLLKLVKTSAILPIAVAANTALTEKTLAY